MAASHSLYSLYVNTQGARAAEHASSCPRRAMTANSVDKHGEKTMSVERKEVGPRMSQIVVHGNTVYLAGIVARDNAGKSVTEQTREILATDRRAIWRRPAPTSPSSCPPTSGSPTSATFAEMNAVWDAWVAPGNTPARATVESQARRAAVQGRDHGGGGALSAAAGRRQGAAAEIALEGYSRLRRSQSVPDIFISYAREDRALAHRLAHALEQEGFKVWWDWDLIGGTNYRAKIREVIAEAKKAIVLWSRHSVVSGFVIDEATEAKKLGKLVPVSVDETDPPFGFGDLHTIVLREPELEIEAIVAALHERPLHRTPQLPSRRRIGKGLAATFAASCIVAAAGAAFWHYKGPLIEDPEQAPSQRIALVIGNTEYLQLPPLANAVRDAERVTEMLEKRRFRVIKAVNVKRDAMVKAVTDFESALSVVGGVGLFYYAGSAVYIDGEDIMLPIDAAEDPGKSENHERGQSDPVDERGAVANDTKAEGQRHGRHLFRLQGAGGCRWSGGRELAIHHRISKFAFPCE